MNNYHAQGAAARPASRQLRLLARRREIWNEIKIQSGNLFPIESKREDGRELIEQKKSLGHGNFLPWIEAEFSMSGVSASRFINVALQFADKSFIVKDLAPTALYALAAPSTPDSVRAEALERAATGNLKQERPASLSEIRAACLRFW